MTRATVRAMRAEARVVRAWLAVILWAALVWSLGSDGFSSGQTSRILGPLIDWLAPNASEAERAELLFLARKTAHVVEYGILAALALRALWLGTRLAQAQAPAIEPVEQADMRRQPAPGPTLDHPLDRRLQPQRFGQAAALHLHADGAVGDHPGTGRGGNLIAVRRRRDGAAARRSDRLIQARPALLLVISATARS